MNAPTAAGDLGTAGWTSARLTAPDGNDRVPVLPGAIAGAIAPPRLRWRAGQGRTLVWLAVALLMLTHLTTAFVDVSPLAYAVVVEIRRFSWLIVAVGTLFEVLTGDPADLAGPMLALLPWVVLGIASALFSVEPVVGLFAIALWLATMMAACLIGQRLRGTNLPLALIGWFAFAMVASIALALLRPRVGTMLDGRFAHGVWRGVFVGKNWLAWYAGFAILLAMFAGEVRWYWRAALGILAVVALRGAHSAGSVAALVAVLGIMALFALWHRLGLSRGMQALANLVVLGGGALVGWAGYAVVLAALGRDTSLTGRTAIWQAYFNRALDNWAFGAGPGSFTDLSLTTGYVGLKFQHLGHIFTPHNMFIAVFGEIGLIGLVAFGLSMAVILGQALAMPRGSTRNLIVAFTLFFLISGLDETHEVVGTGSGLVLNVLLRAWARPVRAARQADAVHA